MEKNLGRCNFCPNFSFKSATEKTRHQSMFHHQKKKQSADKEWKFCCTFTGYQLSFALQSSLSWHKTTEHHCARDSQVQLQKIPSKCKSHQTISWYVATGRNCFYSYLKVWWRRLRGSLCSYYLPHYFHA